MKTFAILILFVISSTFLMYCTKTDQVIGGTTPTPTPPPPVSTSTLVSYKTPTAPNIDGSVESIWDSAAKLSIVPTVPNPGNNLFTGYIGDEYPATIQSMYDDSNIYFLVQYADNTNSVYVSTWYFDPGKKLWAQEPSSNAYDVNGNITRNGFGEDKLAMLWNIDFSTPKFISETCYGSCHVFTPYTDFSVTPAVVKANASGNHYTNGASEKIDMWWAHLSRDVIFNQMDDQYQDWAGGPTVTNLVGGSGNGRHVDGITVSGASSTWPYAPTYTSVTPPQGALNNRQNLKLNGNGASVSVPLWIIPNASNYYYILATDTLAGGKAVKITGVDSTGLLTYAGGTIDPTVGTDYQRTGDPVTGGDGPKCFPSYIASPLLGGRADITCSAVYTGSGWIIEYKRKLRTGDTLKQDVDFSSLQDQQFGLAIWNQSNNQHGIQPNLLLTFKK
ncbi:MAG TPA: hypothetical protein DIC22_02990 [Chitinophagaceae bacterium]|jgi:hypothetical protein|nr:hypothetical protein [Chitinophagaceae bacterium]